MLVLLALFFLVKETNLSLLCNSNLVVVMATSCLFLDKLLSTYDACGRKCSLLTHEWHITGKVISQQQIKSRTVALHTCFIKDLNLQGFSITDTR